MCSQHLLRFNNSTQAFYLIKSAAHLAVVFVFTGLVRNAAAGFACALAACLAFAAAAAFNCILQCAFINSFNLHKYTPS
jgi:Zn-dependent protease